MFGYSHFAQDMQSIRNSLVHLDALALNPRYSEHAKISKALSVVWIASCVEVFWRSYLTELSKRVAAAPVQKRRRHLSTASLFYFDTLAAMSGGTKLKRWNRLIDFFSSLAQSTPVATPTIPYDGRTIRPDHFVLTWKLFGLPGSEFPTPIHRQELNTLADRRNDVAHGDLSPHAVGGSITVGDLRTTIRRMEDIVENSIISADLRWP